MELLRRLNGACRTLSLIPGWPWATGGFGLLLWLRAPEWKVWSGKVMTLPSSMLPCSVKVSMTGPAHHPGPAKSPVPITAQTPVLPALRQGHAGVRGNTVPVGVVIMHLVLSLCSKELPLLTKERNQNQKKPTETGVLDARPQENSRLQIAG